MNKIVGIIGLTLMFSACGDSDTTPEPVKELTKEEVKMEGIIKKIDSIEKDIQVKEDNLNDALKDLEGM